MGLASISEARASAWPTHFSQPGEPMLPDLTRGFPVPASASPLGEHDLELCGSDGVKPADGKQVLPVRDVFDAAGLRPPPIFRPSAPVHLR